MKVNGPKQPALKPQDLVVVIKIAVGRGESLSFSKLAKELFISASEAHAAVQRARVSHLLEQEHGSLTVNRSSLREFLLHGVRYAFPAIIGPVARGLPTGFSAPPLRQNFEQIDMLPLVWSDAQGEIRGASVCPLYSAAPAACRLDSRLYDALAVLDAVRGGAAREREMAKEMIVGMLG